MRVAHLVLTAFVGPRPEGMECCHNDGDETNDHADNLRWDTHSANLLDRRRHGTAPCGEDINTAKLTAAQVLEIRRLRTGGESLGVIAERFHITAANVSHICNRRTWQHV